MYNEIFRSRHDQQATKVTTPGPVKALASTADGRHRAAAVGGDTEVGVHHTLRFILRTRVSAVLTDRMLVLYEYA